MLSIYSKIDENRCFTLRYHAKKKPLNALEIETKLNRDSEIYPIYGVSIAFYSFIVASRCHAVQDTKELHLSSISFMSNLSYQHQA